MTKNSSKLGEFIRAEHSLPEFMPIESPTERSSSNLRASHVSKKYVDKTTSKKIRRAAGPFIAWLDEDEDDESEDDEENEEESA